MIRNGGLMVVYHGTKEQNHQTNKSKGVYITNFPKCLFQLSHVFWSLLPPPHKSCLREEFVVRLCRATVRSMGQDKLKSCHLMCFVPSKGKPQSGSSCGSLLLLLLLLLWLYQAVLKLVWWLRISISIWTTKPQTSDTEVVYLFTSDISGYIKIQHLPYTVINILTKTK